MGNARKSEGRNEIAAKERKERKEILDSFSSLHCNDPNCSQAANKICLVVFQFFLIPLKEIPQRGEPVSRSSVAAPPCQPSSVAVGRAEIFAFYCGNSPSDLGLRPYLVPAATVLVLFSAVARTGVIAADFGAGAHGPGLLYRGGGFADDIAALWRSIARSLSCLGV